MSVTIIPEVLDVGYIEDSQIRFHVMRTKWITPAGRVSQKITNSGRYVAGVVSYVFKDALTPTPSGGTTNRWQNFSKLWDVMQQGGYGCLFVDTNEFTLTDEPIGTGDGSTAVFQILKVTTVATSYTVTRKITRPIHNFSTRVYFHDLLDPADGLLGLANTLVVKVDGTLETHWTVDETTGLITFAGGHIPAAGKVITVSGYFCVPILFEDDDLPLEREGTIFKVNPLRFREIPQDA